MNRTYLAKLIGRLFRAPEGDGSGADGSSSGGGASGGGSPDGQQQQQQQQQQGQVSVEDARAFLADFVSDPEALNAMKDEDVTKQYERVRASVDKHAPKPSEGKDGKQQQGGEIKLSLPKDSKLVQADVDRISAYAREKGLSQEQASEMLQREHDATSSYHERLANELKTKHDEWVKTVNEDKELGGANLAVTQRRANLVIEAFMPVELRTLLKESGYGDHPAMVRFLNNVGAAMDEDQPGQVSGGAQGGGKKNAEDVLYGNPTQ